VGVFKNLKYIQEGFMSETKEKNKKNKEKEGEEIFITLEDGTVYDKKNKTIAGPDGKIYGEFL
jgi:hypothetical protein